MSAYPTKSTQLPMENEPQWGTTSAPTTRKQIPRHPCAVCAAPCCAMDGWKRPVERRGLVWMIFVVHHVTKGFKVPKMEVHKYLISFLIEVGFPYISHIHTGCFWWGFLYFRYVKCLLFTEVRSFCFPEDMYGLLLLLLLFLLPAWMVDFYINLVLKWYTIHRSYGFWSEKQILLKRYRKKQNHLG